MDLGIQQQQARAADETDRPWGEAVKAVVEPNAGFKIDPAEIITFCRETLGGVKTPKTVEVWDLLPRNANGKVLKRQIRDQFWLGRSASGLTATGCGHSKAVFGRATKPGEFEALRQPRCRPEP